MDEDKLQFGCMAVGIFAAALVVKTWVSVFPCSGGPNGRPRPGLFSLAFDLWFLPWLGRSKKDQQITLSEVMEFSPGKEADRPEVARRAFEDGWERARAKGTSMRMYIMRSMLPAYTTMAAARAPVMFASIAAPTFTAWVVQFVENKDQTLHPYWDASVIIGIVMMTSTFGQIGNM